jgi:hypothetical protein
MTPSKRRHTSLSLPGLTRQSIIFEESLLKMDARVKPAHDEVGV